MNEMENEYQILVDKIISDINSGSLSLGDKISSDQEFIEQLGISQDAVTEALRTLEHSGVTEYRQGDGSYVACNMQQTLSNIMENMLRLKQFNENELFCFRLNMDKLVCSLLLEQHSDLERIADRAEEVLSIPAFTVEEEREQDKRFHFLLIEETKNRLLIALMKAASALFSEMIDAIRDVTDVTMKEKLRMVHKNIVAALRSGSKEQCDIAVEQHYQLVDEIIQKAKLEAYFGTHVYNKHEPRGECQDIDRLTGLYVGAAFFQKVEQYIKEHPEEKLMLWAADIQGLRFINEKYGMEMGDRLLCSVAEQGKRMDGFLLGGRIGGDKFCVLRTDQELDMREQNKLLMEKMHENLPLSNVSVKNGVYHIKENDTLSPHAMYVRAVLALQSIKNSYATMVAEYDEKMRNELMISRQIEDDAYDALKEGQFQVYLQPKIDVSNNVVAGAEALVRWIHPQLGFMSPGIFIPLFEKNGFMIQLDFWVWEEVCKILSQWKKENLHVVPISVNVSRNSFEDAELADKIIALVDRYEIEHSLFEIEITEYSCLENFERIQNTIKQLHDAGFIISLDDFGTGYSSMVVLSKIEIDIMKLDMSLIQNDNAGDKRSALEFALQLAHMMQFKTVAEGIETEDQVERIRSLGGDYIQGYFYSKPLPEAEFETYMKKQDQE